MRLSKTIKDISHNLKNFSTSPKLSYKITSRCITTKMSKNNDKEKYLQNKPEWGEKKTPQKLCCNKKIYSWFSNSNYTNQEAMEERRVLRCSELLPHFVLHQSCSYVILKENRVLILAYGKPGGTLGWSAQN